MNLKLIVESLQLSMFIIEMPLSFLSHINLSLDIICNIIGNDEDLFFS